MKTEKNVMMRKQNNPVAFPKTRRPDQRVLQTSARAGKVMPAGFIPLMPQDTVLSGSSAIITAKMEETERMLANAVHFRAHAYFVSLAALDRFDGLDSVAYAWAARVGAESVVDKFTYSTATHDDFYHAFGEHIKNGEQVNSIYNEAYNHVVNYRRKQVSISLPERAVTNHDLARSLWGSTAIARIVPDFDQALLEGEVSLNLVGGDLPVKSADFLGYQKFMPASTQNMVTDADGDYDWTGRIWAELQTDGVSVSLSKLDAARKTQAFAKLRQQYAGNDDELIDMLMRGLEIPNAAYHDPILIGSANGTFGYTQRFASDAANLDTYVTNGETSVSIPLRMPKQPTGGVIVLTYEIIPEPVFDRQADMFLRLEQDELPNALRDHLDTQQVDVVPNRFVDALHTTPDGTFGYAPMNYHWSRSRVGVGGRYLRTLASDPSDEDQQNIWSVRTVDPVLDEDAFLVPTDLAHNVFRDTLSDPFIVQVAYNASIEGITQFGGALYEAQGDYDAVAEVIPTDIIESA